jgi:hypothetical protein
MLRGMANGVDSSLVQLRCQRRDHQGTRDGASPVFLQDGEWAYCEAGKLVADHEFLPTGGMTRQRIESRRTAGR